MLKLHEIDIYKESGRSVDHFFSGDNVVRVGISNGNQFLQVGETGVVVDVYPATSVIRVKNNKTGKVEGNLPYYLEKYEYEGNKMSKYNVTEPVPVATKEQIIDKTHIVHGRDVIVKKVQGAYAINTSCVEIRFGGATWTKYQLRGVAELFNELADAMERIEKQ